VHPIISELGKVTEVAGLIEGLRPLVVFFPNLWINPVEFLDFFFISNTRTNPVWAADSRGKSTR
jgi:hypothetical protein